MTEKLKVLVIDDDDIARELLCDTLRQAGHEVYDLASAIGATRMILDNDIEAVVLDVIMPSINGDKLAKLLREASKGKELTIVLVSSQPIEKLREIVVDARADAVLSKRDIRTDLVKTIDKSRHQRSARRSAHR